MREGNQKKKKKWGPASRLAGWGCSNDFFDVQNFERQKILTFKILNVKKVIGITLVPISF
jgi:hypothetical protein